MSELILDPTVLEETASTVEAYCNNQKSIIDDYLSHTMALSSEWSDETFSSLIEEIKAIKSSVVDVMDEIITRYPPYFRSKATDIRNGKPKF